MLLESDTSQMSVPSWIRRSPIGAWACLMALVTSSLTISSVVDRAASRSPQRVSWAVARRRASATAAGSGGISQDAT